MARHDRMLDTTGGDAAAMAAARTALDLIAASDAPDLAAALVLAFHRDHLASRNENIPVELPAVWAALGQDARAHALAASMTSPGKQADALARGRLGTGRRHVLDDVLRRWGTARPIPGSARGSPPTARR
jgi:hypothetical protein